MKLGYFVVSNELRSWIDDISSFQEKISFDSIQDIKLEKLEYIIIQNNGEIESTDIMQLRKTHDEAEIIMFTNMNDQMINKSCYAYSILPSLIPETKKEFDDIINSNWFKVNISEYKNVIAIHGTHRQAGVTQIALGLAKSLVDSNLKDVLVIGLNPYNPGLIPTIQSQYSLDAIYKMIESGVITDYETLKKYFMKVNEFDYLVGNRDLYLAPSFKGEVIKKIIDLVKDHYDKVILDVGSFYDNYLPITGLQLSDTHILIATQDYISTSEYKNWKESILDKFDFNPTYSHLVINKHASNSTKTSNQVKEELRLPILVEVPFFPESSDAEYESGYIYANQYNRFNIEVQRIAKSLMDHHIDAGQQENKKIFGIFRRNK